MQRKEQGFTLIELMVTIAILGIIAVMAAPSFGQMVAKQQLNSNTRELIAILSKARSQAVLLRKSTTVYLSSGTNTDTNFYWQNTINNNITAPASITSIVFGKDGSITSGIAADTNFIICNSKTGTTRIFALTKMGTTYVKEDGTC